MPLPSVKTTPSDLDVKVWELNKLRGIPLREIATMLDLHIDTVKYHSCEANRIIGTDIVKVKDDLNHLTIPIAVSALKLIGKTFNSEDPKYVDAAIKFLRNAGYTIEQSEVSHVLKDSRSADQDFDDLMRKMKERAVDATIVESLEPRTATNSEVSDIVDGSNETIDTIVETVSEESSDDQPGSSTATPTSSQERDVSILPLTESHIKNPKLEE